MSRTRQYTRKELESLRRADLQSLFKIHGLKGANQKSDALMDQLVSHFATAVIAAAPRPESPSVVGVAKVNARRLKSIDNQTTGRIPDGPRRPATAAATVRPAAQPRPQVPRLPSRAVAPVTGGVANVESVSGAAIPEWEERFRKLEERQRVAEEESDRKLKEVEGKLAAVESELAAIKVEMADRIAELESSAGPSQPRITDPAPAPQVIITDPSPLKRPEPPYSPRLHAPGEDDGGPAKKKARTEASSEDDAPRESCEMPALEPQTPQLGQTSHMSSIGGFVDPHTPSPSHQGTSDDMSRTPGVGDGVIGLPYPVFATTPQPGEPRSPTLDAPPSASRQRTWSSSSLPKVLTPGRKRVDPTPRAVSQAHMDLTTITESDEAPITRRHQTPPVAPLYPASLSRDRTVTPPRLSPSPSITESRFQHPTYPTKGSSLAPGPSRMRQSSDPAREYMEVALHGLSSHTDSPSVMATPSHRTMLGTERYRDTRFGDLPMMSWGSPTVDLGPSTPQISTTRE